MDPGLGPGALGPVRSQRDFLPGEDAPWVDDVRNELAVVHLRALEAYAATELGIGGTELDGGVRAGRQLIRVAPLRERGYRYLMQALADQDNLAEALHVYAELCERLRDQLGDVHPAPPPAALYDQLLAQT